MTLRPKNANSGIAIVGVLLVMVFLGLVTGAAMVGVDAQMKAALQRTNIHESFYTAESGLSRAIFELRRDPAWGAGFSANILDEEPLEMIPGDPDSLFGTYSVALADGGDDVNGWETRWIRSLGKNSFNRAPRVIHGRVTIESPTRFMVMTLGDLRVQQGAEISAGILGTNVIFDPGDGQIVVRSDAENPTTIFYRQNLSGQDHESVMIYGDVEFNKLDFFTFPGVDSNRYRDLALNLAPSGQAVYAEGDLTVDLDNLESLAQGPVDDFEPVLIYAEGDVSIQGEYSRSVLVVAGGNMRLMGSVEPQTPPGPEEPIPQIGLLAGRDVIIPEGALAPGQDMQLEAFIMADGQGDSDGIFYAEGPAAVLGTLNFTGSIAVRGEGDLASAIDMSAFQARAYSFNADLNNNRAIPFLPFIVNLIDWREAGPDSPFPPVPSI